MGVGGCRWWWCCVWVGVKGVVDNQPVIKQISAL